MQFVEFLIHAYGNTSLDRQQQQQQFLISLHSIAQRDSEKTKSLDSRFFELRLIRNRSRRQAKVADRRESYGRNNNQKIAYLLANSNIPTNTRLAQFGFEATL